MSSLNSRRWRGHPFYLNAEDVVKSEMESDHAIGPMTRAQVEEILWRVKVISVAYSYIDPTYSESYALAGTDESWRFVDDLITPHAADEHETFERIEVPLDEIGISFVPNATGSGSGVYMLVAGKIGIDGDGDYWFHEGGIYASLTPGGDYFGALIGGNIPDPDLAPVTIEHTITLPLKSGDFDILLYLSLGEITPDSEITPSAVSITPTITWHSYADLSGGAAWDTTTGGKANGGPGG